MRFGDPACAKSQGSRQNAASAGRPLPRRPQGQKLQALQCDGERLQSVGNQQEEKPLAERRGRNGPSIASTRRRTRYPSPTALLEGVLLDGKLVTER